MGSCFSEEIAESKQIKSIFFSNCETNYLRFKIRNEYLEEDLKSILNNFSSCIFPDLDSYLFGQFKHNLTGSLTYDYIEDTFGRILRTNSKNLIEFFWDPISIYHSLNDDKCSIPKYFIAIIFDYALGSSFSTFEIISCADNLNNHYKTFIHKYDLENNSSSFISYIDDYFPFLPKVLIDKFNKVLFNESISSIKFQFDIPSLIDKSSVISNLMITPLACVTNKLQGSWKKLYSSEIDGRSFNRILFHLVGYEGSTCIIIKSLDKSGCIFGAFVSDPWKDSNKFYGSKDNFLFTLYPTFNLYRTTGRDFSYQWLNSKSYGLPHGLGFGGSKDKPRLFIPDSLEDCTANSSDLTYSPGPFLFDSFDGNFQIDTIEIWSTGGDEALSKGLKEQEKKRQNIEHTLLQARKIDKAQFFSNSFNQEFLLSKTFSHKNKLPDDV